jgi:hypothetical protein
VLWPRSDDTTAPLLDLTSTTTNSNDYNNNNEHDISVVYESVPLRGDFIPATVKNNSTTTGEARALPATCFEKTDNVDRVYFVRLSAQVYLDLSDFELLADTVLMLLS